MKTVISLIVIVSAAIGVFVYLDKEFARCEDIQKIDRKVDGVQKIMEYKFKTMQLETVEDRIYRTKERAGKSPSQTDRERLNELEREKEKILREMKTIEKTK